MESGFGQNLEGFLVKGNLSLAPSAHPLIQGDGSIEGSGTLYFDLIKEYNQNEGVNIQNVSFKNGQLLVPYTFASENLTSASVIIDGGVSIKHTQNSSSITSGGGLTVAGGASIGKNVNIGGIVNVNNNSIINVPLPLVGSDAVNKDYVDSVASRLSGNFTTGQIIIADSVGDSIRGYDFFTTDTNTLTLTIPLVINNTTNANGTLGAFVCYGGLSVTKDVFIAGKLDLNNNVIENLGAPILGTDAVNKDFLLSYVDSKTYGNILGSFGNTEIIIGSTSSNSLTSYNSFTYDGVTMQLNGVFNLHNTTNAIGLGSGGSLTVNGGASFDKNVYIGGVLDVNLQNIKNVQDPVDDYDAVNKRYLEEALSNISINTGTIFNLNNNTIVPQDIPVITYPITTRAFVTKIFVQVNQTTAALYTIYGYKTDTNWYINSSYVGDRTGITFFVRNNFGEAVMQYTNTNTIGFSTINFNTVKQIDNTATSTQINISLLSSSDPVNIPELTFLNNIIDSVKLIVYVSSDLDGKYGLVLINAILRNNIWTITTHNIGDVSGIDFSMLSLPTAGVVQYTNLNAQSDYTIKVTRFEILRSQPVLTLVANTLNPIPIGTNQLTFGTTITNFQLTCVVEVPSENKSALYELNGLMSNAIWKLSSRFIGDYTGIKFSINTVTGIGILEYTNETNVNAYLRFIENVPNIFKPLSVNKGGTGNSYLEPYAVLRGDGSNPIIGTDDFIYKDKVLILGSESSILLSNTTNAIGVGSGGALNVTGGASFEKDVYIGGVLDVNLQNIKSVQDPIDDYDAANKRYIDTAIENFDLNSNQGPYEKYFTLNADVTVPEDIYDFNFSSDVKAFISNVYIETSDNTYSLYTLRGINSGSNWVLSSSLIGNPTGVDFYIREENGSGYVQYTNANKTATKSIRFITSSLISDEAKGSQVNYDLLGNISIPEDIVPLTFSNTTLDSVKLLIYVSSPIDNKYSLYLINCLFNGTEWSLNTNNIGDFTGIRFFIKTQNGNGIIGYTNPNLGNDYKIRAIYINIENSRQPVILNPNTSVPTPLIIPDLHLSVNYYYFQISIFVNVPTLNKSALFEIQGVVTNNKWNINSRYIGDYTGIHFYISTVNGIGYLSYTNVNNTNAIIKVIKDIPLLSLRPLSVSRGGSGSTYLNPYTILRGNGIDPIIGTSDLIYKDNELVIGNSSTIIIQNTRSSINLTTGSTFVAYGGVSINKELFIGEQLVVKEVDITPSIGDISAERTFQAENNQAFPTNITGFSFSNNTIKSFTGTMCVTTVTNDDELDALYEIKGLKKRTGWIIDIKHIGDNIDINFFITNNGQIQYTTANQVDWISTKIKFRALTTTI
jgi:hypothetical protein